MMKNYLIIGGSSGIGKSLVDELKSHSHVIATFRDHQPEFSNSVSYIPFDATKEGHLNLDIEQLDGLVYCPGTINLKPFHRLTEEDFLNDFGINLLGAVKVIQMALPLLKKAQNPAIVLFSTVAVRQGLSFHSSISASKGAVEGFARSLAAELAPKIRVNVVAPSIVDTPMAGRLLSSREKVEASEKRHPLKKIGKPRDIATIASFLLSPEASWITGQIIGVDGGLSSIKTL